MVGRVVLRGGVPTGVPAPTPGRSRLSGPRCAGDRRGWERVAARWTAVLVCVGRRQTRMAERGMSTRPTTISPNSVDLDRFRPAARLERTQRPAPRSASPTSRPSSASAGSPSRRASRTCSTPGPASRDRVPDAHLVLVGDGPDRAALEARTAGWPRRRPGRRPLRRRHLARRRRRDRRSLPLGGHGRRPARGDGLGPQRRRDRTSRGWPSPCPAAAG